MKSLSSHPEARAIAATVAALVTVIALNGILAIWYYWHAGVHIWFFFVVITFLSFFSPQSLIQPVFHFSSDSYLIALGLSWIEFWGEYYFYPQLKEAIAPFSVCGLVLMSLGQVCRSVAMVTASTGFTHTIALHRNTGHELVTHGVYSYLRHPGYFGWFWWSLGTQCMLLNPICLIGYCVVSWRFFAYRIVYEERTLLGLFGHKYAEYMRRTSIGIPFISGYPIPKVDRQGGMQ